MFDCDISYCDLIIYLEKDRRVYVVNMKFVSVRSVIVTRKFPWIVISLDSVFELICKIVTFTKNNLFLERQIQLCYRDKSRFYHIYCLKCRTCYQVCFPSIIETLYVVSDVSYWGLARI